MLPRGIPVARPVTSGGNRGRSAGPVGYSQRMSSVPKPLVIPDAEIDISPIRAQGAGGQNVNKVSSAIHLRFDIRASSLSEAAKEQLLGLRDRRITKDGVIVIKAQRFRTQEQNRDDAVQRLHALIEQAMQVPTVRRATRPTRGSQLRRMASKTQRGKTKALRGRVRPDD